MSYELPNENKYWEVTYSAFTDGIKAKGVKTYSIGDEEKMLKDIEDRLGDPRHPGQNWNLVSIRQKGEITLQEFKEAMGGQYSWGSYRGYDLT